MGKKFSLHLATRYKMIFHELGLKEVNFVTTENTAAFKVVKAATPYQ
jgi:hypothetical protein